MSCVWNAREAKPGRYEAYVEFDGGPFEKGENRGLVIEVPEE